MPSSAYQTFNYLRRDVLSLIEDHYLSETERGRGRSELGYLVRSGLVMLCACWERYNEDLLKEVIRISITQMRELSELNSDTLKVLCLKIKRDKDELSPMKLAGSSWKSTWLESASADVDRLNTPNIANLNVLFKDYFGIPEYTRFWTTDGASSMNNFIGDRGDIAHGNVTRDFDIDVLRTYQDMIVSCVIEIDSKMCIELESRFSGLRPAWDREYVRGTIVPDP